MHCLDRVEAVTTSIEIRGSQYGVISHYGNTTRSSPTQVGSLTISTWYDGFPLELRPTADQRRALQLSSALQMVLLPLSNWSLSDENYCFEELLYVLNGLLNRWTADQLDSIVEYPGIICTP